MLGSIFQAALWVSWVLGCGCWSQVGACRVESRQLLWETLQGLSPRHASPVMAGWLPDPAGERPVLWSTSADPTALAAGTVFPGDPAASPAPPSSLPCCTAMGVFPALLTATALGCPSAALCGHPRAFLHPALPWPSPSPARVLL